MKAFKLIIILICAVLFVACDGSDDDSNGPFVTKLDPESADKSNNLPVYVHYMPWFDTPENSDGWGIHWTMANKDPERVLSNGQREIAAHFYPLIGPYSSSNPDVIRYHFLLMKYSGIDGILIDWYGQSGTNPDVNQLLTNSNAIVNMTDDVGIDFAVVLEDRFAAGVDDVEDNVEYLDKNYYSKDNYIRFNGRPLTLIFGPITINDGNTWESILSVSNEDELFLPLWYKTNLAGSSNVAGEYAWVYEDELSGLENFYSRNRSGIIGAAAYPGFKDFYQEGGWGNSIDWEIDVSANTMVGTLDLATNYQSDVNFMQLITWNDIGEGTMIEPTVEFQFSFLEEVQKYTGVTYGVEELQLVYDWYLLKVTPEGRPLADRQKIDQAFHYLNALRVEEARAILDSF